MAGKATVKHYWTQRNLLHALVTGHVDAIMGDVLGLHIWLESPASADFTFVGNAYQLDEGIGIAVRQKGEMLCEELNRALAAILADGTYRKINARYFPFGIY